MAQILAFFRPLLLTLRLNHQLVLLLLQLLDDRVVDMQRQRIESWSRSVVQFVFFCNALAQTPEQEQAQEECEHREEKDHDGAQKHRIGQESQKNLPYQRRNRSPKKKATSAMLPKNTPNGIW